jgi:hypothetical protein
MKTNQHHSWAAPVVIAALCLVLASFRLMPGAHSFQLYLDDKMVAEQYVSSKTAAPKIELGATGKYNDIVVKYNECNHPTSGRVLTIKDEQDNTLKQWNYEGQTTGYKDPMILKVKDVVALKPKGNNTLRLYYSSKEFENGQLIANVVVGTEAGRTP